MPREPKIKPLHEVLAKLPMPEGCQTVAKKWRCIEVPYEEDNDAMLHWFDRGIPCLVPRERGKPVHDACGGDAIDFVTNPKWDKFPKPKIAFKAGWAGPGTEFEQEEYHQLINSFSDIALRDDATKVRQKAEAEARVKEMEEAAKEAGVETPAQAAEAKAKQEAEDSAAPSATATKDATPSAPAPPSNSSNNNSGPKRDILNLQFFHRTDTQSHPPIPNLSELLDWPEFLHEGAICDNATRVSEVGAVTWWHLDDGGEFVMQTGLPDKAHPEGKHPVKVFLYGPPDSYDWFSHDHNAATAETGKISTLDIFKVTDEELPPQEFLPIITVAVLEAGGRPLISPPNIPHIVITVNKCVMIEQRRICNLFLDEVGYFLQRVKHWRNEPIIYDYIKTSLQEDPEFVHSLVGGLIKLFKETRIPAMKRRTAASLYTILAFPIIFKLPDDGARASLRTLLKSEDLQEVLNEDYVHKLCIHFDVERYWWEPGEIFRVDEQMCCALVYRNHSPVYGPIRPTKELAGQDRVKMLKALKDGTLDDFLSGSGGNKKDELLDELF